MSFRAQSDIRILLVERDESLRMKRAKQLLESGYSISALPDADAAPRLLNPRLYDVIVIDADDATPNSLELCRRLAPAGSGPALVILATNPRLLEATVNPDLVISEPTEDAIEAKLAAFLLSIVLQGTRVAA